MSSRRVVVTGASSGIGAATARLFAEHGWSVVAVARRQDRLDALAASHPGIMTFVADVTRDQDVADLHDFLADTPVHALVNNAGGARGSDTVEAGKIDDWQWMFEVNVLGTKRVTSALLPLLREAAREGGGGAGAGSGAGGSSEAASGVGGDAGVGLGVGYADILTVTSTAGLQAYAGGGGYNAAKFAEHALVGALRLELKGEPIRVTEVAPGMVRTDEFAIKRLGDPVAAAALYEGVDHPLTADDIASVIVAALEQPWHIDQDLIVVRPVAQAAQFALHRGPLTLAS